MAAIPVLVPPASGVLSRAYMTPAMFRAYPTWLDTDDLVQGGIQGVQDDALADVLYQASDWCVGICENMRLDAHLVTGETQRIPTSGNGRIAVKPHDIPVRAITALAYGWNPATLGSLALPDSSMWIEDGREVSFIPGGGLGLTGPALEFGPAAAPGRTTYVQWSYVAGYPNALLGAQVAQGAMSVTVDDPAGILPGDVLRIYDPGASEALTVAASYVPAMPTTPPTATAIPLAAATQHAHVAGTGITGMPRKVLQAVIAYAVALLMREDVSDEEPASTFGPAARTTGGGRGGQASGLVNDAIGWLRPYAPTLRS